MKFLLVGDRHNSPNQPENRIDNYNESLNAKDNEIMELAKTHGVKAILQAGDFWTDGDKRLDKKFIGSVLNRWYKIDNIFNKENTDIICPIISIAGNHDLLGNNIHSLPNTTAGLLDSLGYIKLASREKPIIFEENGFKVAITGNNYHINMDKPEHINDYIIKEKAADKHIHIVHGMLSDKSMGQLIRHTTIDQIKHTEADVTFCGHDHIGFNTVSYDGKYFINPGAIPRIKNDIKEMSRVIKVTLLDISEEGIICTDIPLLSAKPAEEVLSREAVERKKEKEALISELKSEIEQLQEANKSNILDILESLFEDELVDEDIRKDIKQRITEKQPLFEACKPAIKDAEIVEVEIENFESHKKTIVKLDKGFNVIVGESNQGKSGILRAIYWVYKNKPTNAREAKIRIGEKFARVTIKLANGYAVQRYMSDKKNIYKIFHPDGKVEEGNTKMLSQVQEILGFNEMVVGQQKTLPINFYQQGTGWYLIGNEFSGIDKARIIGSIKGTNVIDAVNKDLDSNIKSKETDIKRSDESFVKLSEEIQEQTLEIQQDKELLQIIELALLIKDIKEFIGYMKIRDTQRKIKNDICDIYNPEKIQEEQKEIEELIRKIQDVGFNSKQYFEANSNLKKVQELVRKFPDVDELREEYTLTNDAYRNLIEIRQNMSNANDATVSIRKIRKWIKRLNEAYNPDDLLDVKEKLTLYENIKSEISNFKQFKKESEIARENRNELANKFLDCSNKQIEILKTAKVCPTCFSEVSEDTISNISKKMRGELYND